MIANLHTHTARCHHATGTEQEYAEAALEAGLKVLGFSDHTPYFFPGDYYSRMRMYPEELDGYVASVRRLQKEYADRLEIPLGLEVEYYPSLFPELLPRLRDAGIEYMLLGQHWNKDEMDQEYNGRPTESEEKLECYCNQRGIIIETYEYLLTIPDEKVREEHLATVEKGMLAQYTPQMKKLTFSQGKMLIKLVDRECDQTGYELIRTFMGSFKASFYQAFAALFGASLKRGYDPDGDDAEIEEIIYWVDQGVL